MAEQRLTQNAKQTDDAARLQRAETQPEQEEQLVQTEAARLQRVMANPAGADPDDITGLQQTAGNRAVSQLLTSVTGPAEEPVIQAKLMVGAPGDRYEQEADRMADKVMATVVPTANQPDESGPVEARRQPAAESTIQRFQTLTQIDEAIRKRKERAKNRAQQKKNPPNTQTPLQQTVQNKNTALVGSGTEAEKQQKQKTRWEVGNAYSRRNKELLKPGQQQKQQPKTETTQPVVAQQQPQTEQQPQQQQQTEQQKQPQRRRIPRFRVAELKAKHLRYQQKQMALALTSSNITKEMIDQATRLIREGEETEEKKLLKQNLRKVIGQQFSDDNKQPQQQEQQQQQQQQQQDVKQEEPEDEAEFAAMATVALEKAEEAEKEAEDEAEETEEETEAAEEETEAEEAEEVEAEEEEEAEARETENGETEDDEELGVTDWPLSVLLAQPEEEVVQRDISPELKSSITAFSQPDTYRYDAETTKKRAASTRIAREEPGIPGLKGVSEDIWLKPLAGLMRQPAQTNDETETAPANTDGSFEVEDTVEQRLRQQKGKGQPLPTNVRSDMEARFGANFEQVRIHTGSEAAQLSETLHAQAFTHGNDIFFNAGKSNFDTTEDKRLLAHELTHVIQQMGYGKKDDPGNG
ncbi:MAG: hypothetical protein FOGNACKC_04710 [Anaerolineae bacterium]|nr:hypothetical protein [Anaerolineae bacterium]